MVETIPKVVRLPLQGIWSGREKVVLIPVRKHNRFENLNTVAEALRSNGALDDVTNWGVLLEGYAGRLSRASYPIENGFLSGVAKEHAIEMFNPIIDPYSDSILREVNVSPEVAACSALFFDCLGGFKVLQNQSDFAELIPKAACQVARKFGMSDFSVRETLSSLHWSEPLLLEQELISLVNVRRSLIQSSNLKSRKYLQDGILNDCRKPNLFIICGAEHESVFEPYFMPSYRSMGLDQKYQGPLLEVTDRINPSRADVLEIIPVPLQSFRLSGFSPLAATSIDFFDAGERMAEIGDISARVAKVAKKLSLAPWSDFLYLERKLSSTPLKAYTAKNMAALLEMDLVTPCPLPHAVLGGYSRSNLMKYALADPREHTSENWLALDQDTLFTEELDDRRLYQEIMECAHYSAKALMHILIKIGNELPEEADIILGLVNAVTPSAREFGAQAACHTSQHIWRHNDDILSRLLDRYMTESDEITKGNLRTAIVFANPVYLFIRDQDGNFILYKGKDSRLEDFILLCGGSIDPVARSNAYRAIAQYISLKNRFDNSAFNELLLQALEESYELAILPVYNLACEGDFIDDPTIVDRIVKYTSSGNWEDRGYSLLTLEKYLEKGRLKAGRVREIARKLVNDENEFVRCVAIRVTGNLLSDRENKDSSIEDMSLIFSNLESGKQESARTSATTALSAIVLENMDLLTQEQLTEVEHVCSLRQNVEPFLGDEREIINKAYAELIKFSALRDLGLLLELEGHPSKSRVEELVRKKDRYRDTIGPLLGKIEELSKANAALEEKVKQLGIKLEEVTTDNLVLTNENTELKQRLLSCMQELARLTSKSRFRHIKKVAYSIGGTVVRNVIKGKNLSDVDFVKSLAIDLTWDELPEFIEYLRGENN